ncbi:serine phosphatase [Streptomyces sp. SPB78]|uniref:PP2C family protein-serine/threonine phosphatase n=1 Tax=Streptomyces sp. (strain SPB78) TaxID=591157 RepID=UPI0001B583FF|nr:GAF domain-containing SpoIIE family protein phosphatase [Streptomyces sp. SPB78]EFK99859.1 serine phosphatase [Streptomyces sp. SPB78]
MTRPAERTDVTAHAPSAHQSTARKPSPTQAPPSARASAEARAPVPHRVATTPRTPLDHVPPPALRAGPDGLVREINDAAALLLPRTIPGSPLTDTAPAWFAGAHARAVREDLPGIARGALDGRTFEASPVRHEGGEFTWWLRDAGEEERLRAALRTERARNALLDEASTQLLSSLNADRALAITARLAARHLADAAVVVSPWRGRRVELVLGVAGGAPLTRSVRADPAEVPGLVEALQGFPPVPSRWLDPAQYPDWALPEGFGTPASVLVTPMPGHGVPAGALVLLRKEGGRTFGDDEESLARLFALRAGTAVSAALLYAEQAALTKTLTRELLPPPLHRVDGIDLAGGYRASADRERVGGDFYDVHPAAGGTDGECFVVLGDVCGKGLEAAILTGKIRNTLHALLPLAADHQRVLSLLNAALLTSHHTRFATLVLASARAEADGGVRLRVTSAGHPQPLLVRADGTVEQAGTHGTLVGVLPEVRATTDTVRLAPGETCLLYTDGITEAKGGPLGETMFGEDRLSRAAGECAGMPAGAIVERVRMLAEQWVGAGRHDDMAVVAITAPKRRQKTAGPA